MLKQKKKNSPTKSILELSIKISWNHFWKSLASGGNSNGNWDARRPRFIFGPGRIFSWPRPSGLRQTNLNLFFALSTLPRSIYSQKFESGFKPKSMTSQLVYEALDPDLLRPRPKAHYFSSIFRFQIFREYRYQVRNFIFRWFSAKSEAYDF